MAETLKVMFMSFYQHTSMQLFKKLYILSYKHGEFKFKVFLTLNPSLAETCEWDTFGSK